MLVVSTFHGSLVILLNDVFYDIEVKTITLYLGKLYPMRRVVLRISYPIIIPMRKMKLH